MLQGSYREQKRAAIGVLEQTITDISHQIL